MANKEIGRIGQRRYGGTIYEEFLHELRGTRGIEVYREMSENDDVVGAILFAIEMLVRQCDWNVEPGGDTAKDKEAAEFVESCMESITGPTEGESIGLNTEDLKKKMSDYYGEYFESVKTSYSEALHNALENSGSEETLSTWHTPFAKG